MARSSRRFFLPAVLALFVVLFSADRLAVPVEVNAAFDPNGPAWDPLSTFDTSDTPLPVRYPPRLLAGTNSHDLPADALTRNGYCLDVNIGDITPNTGGVSSTTGDGLAVAGVTQLGFFVFASDPIDPDNPLPVIPVPLPVTGLYVDGVYVPAPGDPIPPAVDSQNTGSGSSGDDVYCVVVQAPAGYQTLNIEWHYLENGSPGVIALPEIPIVSVTLEKIGDGIFGSPAEVCTVGWDSAFLTGRTSNAGGLSGVTPDPLDDVQISDFVTSGGSVNVFVDYVRPVGTEWCAGIGSTTVESDVQVTFEFDAVYNRVNIGTTRDHDADDQPMSVSLPADRLVDIKDVVELRHVTSDGYVPPRNPSDLIVINSIHTICLAGTDAGDTLTPNNVHFVTLSGDPGVSNLTIFNKTAAAQPDLVGVLDGTLCFSYTSAGTGEQAVFVTFSDNGIPTNAEFDTDDDGNGLPGLDDTDAGPLIVRWAGIDGTIITLGGSPTEPGNDVTFDRIELPASFNLADGTFIAGATLREWVFGPPGTGGTPTSRGLISGALLRARVVSECGYFVVPDDSRPTVITGRSVGGQFELSAWESDSSDPYLGDTDATADAIEFSTLNDGGCTASSLIRIEIEAFLPDDTTTLAAPLEWVEFALSDFQPGMKVPKVAWAGQFVRITYAIASDEVCEGQEVLFVRPDGQPGSFVGGPGVVVNGPGSAIGTFDDSCSTSVVYESEEPGEVDVEAFLEDNDFSKFAFPIFFLAFEDVTVDATPDQFVSTFGDVTARVRGYFPGSNPSGRPQETKADGRTVPADRWVLPDDWEKLKGESSLRSAWGGVQMPESIVTFFMENETVMNNYKAGVKHGAAGFFIPDSPDDFSFNVNPHTQATTLLGTPTKPRMMSSRSDGGGEASVDTFGDRNLSFEECAANAITGNPHCEPEDVVGRTRYFAVAEYPQVGNRGKWPAVASNVAETVWLWAGYKAVTIVNTDSPQIKYVVAHLRDRDGFCDAANFNNTLGVLVDFQIDAGGGVIIEAADRPFTINGTRQFATATTFDTTDANGRPINTHIARPPLFAEQPDECQAWIKITNSLLVPTNVIVTFPAPPSPIPGDIRITNLQCEGAETITVRNFGSNEVNLGGFSLESAGTDIGNAEQLDLIGILQPGESKTFPGGPAAPENNWIGTGSEVFGGAGDFASLTWEDYSLSTVFCDGTRVDQSPLVSFPPEGEGEIKLDIIIPFGAEIEVPLVAGWNMVSTGAGTVSIETAFAEFMDTVEAIYVWDPVLGEWTRFIPGAPDGVNTIDTIGAGTFMWVLAKGPFTLTLPK